MEASLKAVVAENVDLKRELGYKESEKLNIEDQLVILKNEFFGVSSEKTNSSRAIGSSESVEMNSPKKKIILPSKKNPDLFVVTQTYDFQEGESPCCSECTTSLQKMNQYEEAEYVTIIQRSYHIIRQRREKYRCTKCHSNIVTTPAPKRLVQGGQYSTEFAVDAAVQKYAYHMPIERQVEQAREHGLNVDHQTVIEQTHHLAQCLEGIYSKIKDDVCASRILYADETSWRMLEGDEKHKWWVWGFFNRHHAYYEPHDTRSGEVASAILQHSKASYLMVDGYTGYHGPSKKNDVTIANCWAHARRKFFDIQDMYDVKPILHLINSLFSIDKKASSLADLQTLRKAESSKVISEIQQWISEQTYLPRSGLGRAIEYLNKYWIGLTVFLKDAEVPLDNNHSERLLRGPVLGRKNFYGNHSPRGARTTAILYSIIESCKLNDVNPYSYILETVNNILNEKLALTPHEYAQVNVG